LGPDLKHFLLQGAHQDQSPGLLRLDLSQSIFKAIGEPGGSPLNQERRLQIPLDIPQAGAQGCSAAAQGDNFLLIGPLPAAGPHNPHGLDWGSGNQVRVLLLK
jgi:hypothetical protein